MKNKSKLSLIITITVVLLNYSCKREVNGCTDLESENFNSSATLDDGSCIYPYEKFLGTYTATETYTSSNCGNGTDQYSVIITKGNGNREIIVTGLGGGFEPIDCSVNYFNSSEFYNTETELIQSPVGYWDVFINSAIYSNGLIIMNYNAYDFEYSDNCSSLSATVQMTKQ